MQKTSSHIEVVDLTNTIYPNGTIVRPPAYLKVVRCTVIYQTRLGTGSRGYLSTVTPQTEFNVLRFSNTADTATAVPPAIDQTITNGIETFVFDRLGVGYMTDNFYVSDDSGNAQFIFIWEGINQSNE